MIFYFDIILIAILAICLVVLAFTGLLMLYKKFMEWGIKQLEYKRYFSKEGAFEGESVYFIEEMTNNFFLTFREIDVESYISSGIKLLGCTSDDEMIQHFISTFTIKPFTKIKRVHKAICVKRGHYLLESAAIEYAGKDVFIDSKYEFNIYPSEIALEKKESLNMYMNYSNFSRYPIIEDAFSINGIREYGYGDAMSRVNHKATAKAGKLMVNTNDYVLGRKIMVYMNFQMIEDDYMPIYQYEELMEKGLSYVTYLIGECERNGFMFGFACNSRFSYGGRSARFPMNTGFNAYIDILNTLACVRTAEGDSILPAMDKDIDENISDTEIFFFTLRVDDAVNKRLDMMENMGNVVSVIEIDEV